MWRKFKRFTLFFAVSLFLVPVLVITGLRWIDPPGSMLILRHKLIATLSGSLEPVKAIWTDINLISPNMAVAVIASEDQRFASHYGIDFTELGKVLSDRENKFRGASTITQQTAKNLFLWPERSLLRKALEAGLALLMEQLLTKQRILEIYLNIAQTGPASFGVTEAARSYFRKSVSHLTPREAALIAACLPNPEKYSVINPSGYVLERQRWILQQMKQLGGNAYLKLLQ